MTDMQNEILNLHNLSGPHVPSRTGNWQSPVILSDAIFAAPTQSEYAKLDTQTNGESVQAPAVGTGTSILVQPNVEPPVAFDRLSFSSHAFLRPEFSSIGNRAEQLEYEKLADFMARIRNNWMQIDSISLEMMS
jgi:hypothetical protein